MLIERYKPRYFVQKMPHVGGKEIPSDEPCLVIRAQDTLAIIIANYYIQKYTEDSRARAEVVAELLIHRNAIAEWQMKYGSKIADR